LHVLSGIAVGRLHSKSPRALGRNRFCHRIFLQYVDDVGKLFGAHLGTYIVLYADDILLVSTFRRGVLALDLEGVHDLKLHHPSSSVATSNQ